MKTDFQGFSCSIKVSIDNTHEIVTKTCSTTLINVTHLFTRFLVLNHGKNALNDVIDGCNSSL